MGGIPLVRPPYTPRNTNTIADLIARQGQIQAQGAAASGDIWGRAVSNLGQIGAGALQAHQEQKAAKRAQVDEAQRAEAFGSLMQDPQMIENPGYALKQLISIGYEPERAFVFAKGFQAFGAVKGEEPLDPTKALPLAQNLAQAYMMAGETEREQMRPAVEWWAGQAKLDPEGQLAQLGPDEFLGVVQSVAAKKKMEGQIVETVDEQGRRVKRLASPEELQQGVPVYQEPEEDPAARLARIEAEAAARARGGAAGQPPPAPDDSGRILAEAWAEGRAFPSTQKATTAALAYMEAHPEEFPNKPRKLGVTQQQEVTRTTDTLATIGDVRAAWQKVKNKVGPVSYRFNEFARTLGLGSDPDFVTFNTLLRGMGNLEIKRITGAQMSEPEAARLLKGMATGTMKPADFEAALQVMERNARRNREVILYGKVLPKKSEASGGLGSGVQAALDEMFPPES